MNGTTNYMLTRMVEDGLSYDAALKEAQEKGFAEADPTADVDGFDAAAKIAILASIAFNSRVTIDDVHTEGIRNVTTMDLDAARDMGYCVKLLALAHRTDEGVDAVSYTHLGSGQSICVNLNSCGRAMGSVGPGFASSSAACARRASP